MGIDIGKIKKIHFVGIKGIAMASLAVYVKERGFSVSGTDTDETFPSDAVLNSSGISVTVGFDPSRIARIKPDLVIYTGAHGGSRNSEVLRADALGIPTMPHGRALGMFMEGKRQISVAGSHGKTTTTAMIATILNRAGYDPSYAIGSGEVSGLGLPGHFGKGDVFIAEADEYATDPEHDNTPRFLWQNPDILVVTNIDYDHPDVYGSLEDVIQAFIRLRNKVNAHGEVILSQEDANCRRLIWLDSSVSTVGFSGADYEVKNIHFSQGRTFFGLEMPGVTIGEFIIQVPGNHNAMNAAMAAVAAHETGLSWQEIREGLYAFGGISRRFEKIGESASVIFYDDYAHHPSEIRATLAATRAWYPDRRIITVFQPHTYSRSKSLLEEFSSCFGQSSIVITTDIYASARESDTLGMTGKLFAEAIAGKHMRSYFLRDAKRVGEFLQKEIKKGDIVIFMGAGNIYQWGRGIVKKVSNKQ